MMMSCLIKLELSTLAVTGLIVATGASDNDMRIAIAALATAISILFGIVLTNAKTIAKKLAACEDDRADLWKKIAEMEHERK